MKRKAKSTYDEFIEDKNQRRLIDKEYRELLISEILLAVIGQLSDDPQLSRHLR